MVLLSVYVSSSPTTIYISRHRSMTLRIASLAIIWLCYGISAAALNHLDTLGLSPGQKSVFEEAIGALDANFDGDTLLVCVELSPWVEI